MVSFKQQNAQTTNTLAYALHYHYLYNTVIGYDQPVNVHISFAQMQL